MLACHKEHLPTSGSEASFARDTRRSACFSRGLKPSGMRREAKSKLDANAPPVAESGVCVFT